jgi:hypothetical protein
MRAHAVTMRAHVVSVRAQPDRSPRGSVIARFFCSMDVAHPLLPGDVPDSGHSQGAEMTIRTRVKAGALTNNHGLRVRTNVKAGALNANHGLRLK